MEKIPAMDQEALLRALQEKAAAYAPQWRMDTEDPDVGTALAFAFTRMQEGVIHRYGRLAQKHQSEFFSCLGIGMKPAAPAAGYVAFGLVNQQVKGVELPAGTALTAQAADGEGQAVPVQTKDDLFVGPVKIQAIYESYDGLDYIGSLYQEGEGKKPFTLFGFEGENLQSHEFYIGHESVFSLKTRGEVLLRFFEGGGEPVEKRWLERLSDAGMAEFSYYSGDGYHPFESCMVQGDALVLKKGAGTPPWEKSELEGRDMYWLRCRVKDGRGLAGFCFREAGILSRAWGLLPESVNAGGMDCMLKEYFPFGEQFSLYNEVYFVSDEVFEKAGAQISLSFYLEFARIPLNAPDQEIDWKLIMKKSSFQTEQEYDITIGEVIWEYFNGKGWVRLFEGREYAQIFGTGEGLLRRQKRLSFTCPADLRPALVNGRECRCIRARILKVNNAFKLQGQYISPVLTATRLEYGYEGRGPAPGAFVISGSGERQLLEASSCLGQMYAFHPVRLAGDKCPALYIGTDQPWRQGPCRILWIMERGRQDAMPPLKWEYEAEGRWREMNPADETGCFSRTGLAAFSGIGDGVRTRRFGRELYWLRLTDTQGHYAKGREDGEKPPKSLPRVLDFYENAVRAWTVSSGFEEYLTMERWEENASFRLQNRGIHSLELWEQENASMSAKERERLKEQGALREVTDGSGQVLETWVRWEERESLSASGPRDRHYLLDANEGIVTFGDGSRGRVPAPGVLNGLHVQYSLGGGEAGNLEKGQVTGLDLDAGFISQAVNPAPFYGGYDRETAKDAIRRGAWELKHRFRAVTPGDYEKLAMDISRSIERAACFGGVGPGGEPKPGHITLAVLQKQFKDRAAFFPELKRELLSGFKGRTPAGLLESGRFHIVEPVMVEICVRLDLWVDDFSEIFKCRRLAAEALERFLDPVCGGFGGKGWPIGTLPARSQIDAVLKNSGASQDMRNLMITGIIRENGSVTETSLEDMGRCPFALPLAGGHKIMVHVR